MNITLDRRAFLLGSAAVVAVPGRSASAAQLYAEAAYSGPTEGPIEILPSGAPITTSYTSGNIFITPGTWNYVPGRSEWANVNIKSDQDGVVQCFLYCASLNNKAPYNDAMRLIACGPNPDPYFLLKCLMHQCAYGIADNALAESNPGGALWNMRYGRLQMTCGTTTKVLRHAFGLKGIATRQVHLQTTDMNGYDDGHILMEFWDTALSKWVLVDPYGFIHRDNNNAPLSLAELVEVGLPNVTSERLMGYEAVHHYTWSSSPAQPWQAAAFYQLHASSEAKYRAWADRLFHIPGVHVPGTGVVNYIPDGFPDVSGEPRYANQVFKTKAQWLTQFYS